MVSQSLFCRPSTLERLRNSEEAVALLGGGCAWNFGDILQLQNSIRQHRRRNPAALILPFHELGLVPNVAKVGLLSKVFEAEDFVFSDGRPPEVAIEHAQRLGLVPVSSSRRGSLTLHVFGGGFLNRFWGRSVLDQVEATLELFSPDHYLLSGQQIDPEFAMTLALHAQRWRPELLGCRDLASLDAARSAGLDAEFSGDDTLEEMARAGVEAARAAASAEERLPFALHMNLSAYTYLDDSRPAGSHPADQINPQLEVLHRRYGSDAKPLLLNAYIDSRASVMDTFAALPQTIFPERFPEAVTLDLAGALMSQELGRAARRLAGAERLISSSYHTALLGKMVGIPTYLFAFNDYYRQKKQGLDEPLVSLEQFLDSDPAVLLASQHTYLESLRAGRAKWNEHLATVLAAKRTAPRVTVEQLTTLQRSLTEQREQIDRLEKQLAGSCAREVNAEGRIASLQSEREALLGRLEQLAARLEESERLRTGVASELAAITAHRNQLVASLEAPSPLRHRVVDALNERLKSSARVHTALKRVLDR